MPRVGCVDSELGRIACGIYGKLAAEIKPAERLYTYRFDTVSMKCAAVMSYRKSVELMNDLWHRDADESIKLRTFTDHIEKGGRCIEEELSRQGEEILREYHIEAESREGVEEGQIPQSARQPHIPQEETQEHWSVFQEKIHSFNEGREECEQIKRAELVNETEILPEKCVYICVDEVGVKHQKDSRKDGADKDGKVVENTVIQIRAGEGCYILTAGEMKKAFALLLAFVLATHILEDRQVYFFYDGAENIRKNIETYFSWRPYYLLLDWYHLCKRVRELLSMALGGTKESKRHTGAMIRQRLWAGNVDEAIAYIRQIADKAVRNQKKIEELISYLERKRSYVACYALRSLLQYQNASNPVEKANDLLVAQRQKHNGMSWSYDGSGALAVITALVQNGQVKQWLTEHRIPFSFTPESPSSLPVAA